MSATSDTTPRRPIVAANWKMNLTPSEAARYVETFVARLEDGPAAEAVEVVLAPAMAALDRVAQAAEGTRIALAAQNVSPEPSGAFTGEVSAAMLADLGCRYGIVGHSERRALFGEASELVSRKAAALLGAGIRPIVCVGETLAEREAGRTDAVVGEQLDASLADVPPDRAGDVVLAYEPVWAIGTGETATPELAQTVHQLVRERLRAHFGDAGDGVRIQYGGSVKPENTALLMAERDIDGALVGGASLDPESFASIVRLAAAGP